MREYHGMRHTPEYEIWKSMKQRCYNPKNKRYSDWGGRGIKMCDRWKNSFKNFIEDMGKRPPDKHSIDRIDNDKDYCPENCKWATLDEQVNNARSNILITYNGKTLNVSQWSKLVNIKAFTILARINLLGWSHEKALTTPVRRLKRK